MRLKWIVFAFTLLALPLSGWADTGSVYLVDKKGERHLIAELKISETSYALHMHHDRFKDFFLSMKEMKCLEGPEVMCHLPYPYDNPHTLEGGDLKWLEHDMLFMFKKPSEFGANFWNGMYFKLKPTEFGYRGAAEAVDLNELAAPPEDLMSPPFDETLREEMSHDKRWLPHMEIHLTQ